MRSAWDVATLVASCREIHGPDGARVVRERDREVRADFARRIRGALHDEARTGVLAEDYAITLSAALEVIDALLREEDTQ